MRISASVITILVTTMCGVAPAGSAAAARPDFTGLWQVADSGLVIRPDFMASEADYTPEAWANLQDYRRNWEPLGLDPVKFCVRYGMPNTQTTRARDYLFDIQQTDRRITILIEYMDAHRVIRLDRRSPPETATASNDGYSIGRWEGDTLHVTTTLLKATSTAGTVQRSEQARIEERWRLRNDPVFGRVVDIEMSITDPLVFRRAMRARQVLKPAPADASMNEYGCADALWEDRYNARKAELDETNARKDQGR